MEKIIWKNIKNFEQAYQVSSTGLVRNKKTKKLKTLRIIRKYYYADLHAQNKRLNIRVNRLVATHFLNNYFNLPQVNHKNGNKLDNRVENLEWCTAKENILHALKNGLTKKQQKNEGNIKYSNEVCREVIKRVMSGMTYIKSGKKYNMPYSTVAHLIRGSRRKIVI